MSEQRRNRYRIQYERDQCPTLRLHKIEFDVIDLSEEGLRFSLEGYSGVTVGQSIGGSLTFKDGNHSLVYGTVTRIDQNTVSVTLTQPIPYPKIMDEQRRLIVVAKAKK